MSSSCMSRLFLSLALLFSLGLEGGCDLATPGEIACPRAVCSEHGACSEINQVNARPVCTCDEGYTGGVCAGCADGYHRTDTDACVADELCAADTCGAKGSCIVSQGVAACACDPGYTGARCTDCYAGYHLEDTSCVVDQKCRVTSCASAGDCSDASGQPVCTCITGYTGTVCDACTAGFHRDTQNHCLPDILCAAANPCTAHGTCQESGGLTSCACDPGYTGATCADCYPGYHDDAGSCVLDDQCTPTSCSNGAGACSTVDGVLACACFPAYTGANCQSCAAGYHRDAQLACVADASCMTSSTCSVHSACDDTTGVIRCVCQAGYAGTTCASCYPGYHDDGNGGCTLDQHCVYDAGTASPHYACGVPNLQNNGCDDAGGVVSCSCLVGWEGTHCEINIDNCVNTSCNTGRCIDASFGGGDGLPNEFVCLCLDGTYGLSCP